MSRTAGGLMAASVLWVAILGVAVLVLPMAWIIAFFASTTVLNLIVLGAGLWTESPVFAIAEAKIRP